MADAVPTISSRIAAALIEPEELTELDVEF